MLPLSPSQIRERLNTLLREGNWSEAEEVLQALRAQSPFESSVLLHLGMVHAKTGRIREAMTFWRQALAADPRNISAMVNLSCRLLQMANHDEAIRYAEMAVRIKPSDPTLVCNLAVVLTVSGDFATALHEIENGLRRNPAHLDLRFMRVQQLVELGRTGEARQAAVELLASREGQGHLKTLRTLIQLAARDSDWAATRSYQEQLIAAAQRPDNWENPVSIAVSVDDPALLRRIAPRNGGVPPPAPRPGRTAGKDRITIGYLSPDFRDHPVSHMLQEVLQRHDRERFRVVALGTLPPDDGSMLARRIAELADESVDLSKLDDEQAVRRIRALGIDVLVDLAGSTNGARLSLLSARPCPAQLMWLGCPATTGAEHYDGFLVDEVLAPLGYEVHCSEPLIRLPCCYHPISTGLVRGASRLDRAALGLPADALVVGMLQQSERIRPPFIDHVAAVLGRHAGVHLWLRVKESSRPGVLAHLATHGIPEDRVHFTGFFTERADYLRALELADLIIDSHPYGGHSTTGEAISLGTPVAVLAGRSIHTRVGASMMQEVGLADLVSHSIESLLATIDRLLGDPAALDEWRRRFAAAAAVPSDGRHRRLTAALEDAYVNSLAPLPSGNPT